MTHGDGLTKLAKLYASKEEDCGRLYSKKCGDCPLNRPILVEWSEDPKWCTWVQHLDDEFSQRR